MLRRRGLICSPRFLWECLTSHTVSPFPAPATSHAACGFPALRAPAHFPREGLCDLSSRGVFRRIYEISNSVICEQSDSRVHPSPTPPLPAETLAQEAPRLLGLRLEYILRLSSCRVMGGDFVISPLPRLLTKELCAAGPVLRKKKKIGQKQPNIAGLERAINAGSIFCGAQAVHARPLPLRPRAGPPIGRTAQGPRLRQAGLVPPARARPLGTERFLSRPLILGWA